MSAPIVSISFSRQRIPLVVRFAITGSRQSEADCVFVRVVDADGNAGWGEASPLPVVTGDTVEGALAFLEEMRASCVGRTPLALVNELVRVWRPRFGATQTSALCGLETALLDLRARAAGLPLHALLHTGDARSFTSDITVPALAREELAPFWTHFAGHGFSVFKVKVTGADLDADFLRSMDAWEHAPRDGGRLILDGNQGFSAQSARTLVNRLEAAGACVDFFEQPLVRGDDEGLARLLESGSQASGVREVRVCLDESVRSADDLLRIVARHGAAAASGRILVNLKIMKAGVLESLLIGQLAQRAGCAIMLGGMMETDLAMTASLHLGCALGGAEACDLDTPFYLRTLACVDSPYAGRTCALALPAGTGLGVTPKNVDTFC